MLNSDVICVRSFGTSLYCAILTHFRQNKLPHTMRWKSRNSILGISRYVI